jgi:serine protease Do
MSQNRSLAILSVAAALACSSTASTQSSAKTPIAAAAPAIAAAKPVTVPAGDFRRQFIEVAKTVRPSVVAITSVSTVEMGGPGGEGNPLDFFFRGLPHPEGKQRRQGIGSGVIIDARGYILTNNHVVEDADELKVVFSDDTEVPAEVVGTDPKTDVAVVKLKANGHVVPELRPVAIGDSDKLEVGEWVMAIGSPFGLKQTVSAGIVSAVGRGNVGITDYEDFVQTDAAINPGNSGGPLVNLNGALVGLNTAIASRSGGSQGVGFAIPVNMAKAVMKQLIDNGQVTRGYLGVYIADLHEDLAKSFGYNGRGVLVQDVSAGSPGAKAGLKAGDIIIERDGKPVIDTVVFRNGIASTPPGTTLALTVFRDGKKVQLSAKLEALPAEQTQAAGKPGKQGAEQGGRGLAISDLTPELKQRLGIDASQGAVIVRVVPDSAAERSGLQPGDVVMQIGKDVVKNAKEAERAFAKNNAAQPLRLRIVREGHGMFVLLAPVEK